MAMLLKKVWESVSNRATSFSSSSIDSVTTPPSYTESSSSLGDFDRLPIDVVLQIVRLVGPKDAARLSVVCKSWRPLVSDNRLWIYFLQNYHDTWDSVFFVETHLRSGYPIQTFSSPITELSFMRIYGQRVQVPGAVIVDGGSGHCKYGWSKNACPSGRSATFLEFGNIESPMYTRLQHFFATIYSSLYRMQVKASAHPIVVSLPLCHYDDTEAARASRRQLKDAIYTALFDMNVPAVCAINQATLALYAAQRTSGIVVNIGFQVTSVVPILHGKVMRTVGVEVMGVGALKVTGFLREQMQQNNLNFESLHTVQTLKENLCYVAADYEAELYKDTQASFEVPGEGWFTLSKERFKTGEVLFQPSIAGVCAMGLQQAVALCMDHCHASELTEDDAWFKTIVLSGGTSCLPGLAERLEKELHGLLPPSISNGIRVISPPYGADSAWIGAKLIGNLSTFPGSWCVTKKQFRRKSRFTLAW
ncbi:actin-related protein 8 isoform X1 [Populus alba x Populus x berolinensis]|uniref:Actin-related protein 8 isoform X1 n=1 Tax=Populus alba x Populus x berolinensis TaxID=444605 RepID=A0AAD6RVG5_9ROSI|nr:actin-related protein 8 isoform X1 [Populus alba x Populus x berolinensis]